MRYYTPPGPEATPSESPRRWTPRGWLLSEVLLGCGLFKSTQLYAIDPEVYTDMAKELHRVFSSTEADSPQPEPDPIVLSIYRVSNSLMGFELATTRDNVSDFTFDFSVAVRHMVYAKILQKKRQDEFKDLLCAFAEMYGLHTSVGFPRKPHGAHLAALIEVRESGQIVKPYRATAPSVAPSVPPASAFVPQGPTSRPPSAPPAPPPSAPPAPPPVAAPPIAPPAAAPPASAPSAPLGPLPTTEELRERMDASDRAQQPIPDCLGFFRGDVECARCPLQVVCLQKSGFSAPTSDPSGDGKQAIPGFPPCLYNLKKNEGPVHGYSCEECLFKTPCEQG